MQWTIKEWSRVVSVLGASSSKPAPEVLDKIQRTIFSEDRWHKLTTLKSTKFRVDLPTNLARGLDFLSAALQNSKHLEQRLLEVELELEKMRAEKQTKADAIIAARPPKDEQRQAARAVAAVRSALPVAKKKWAVYHRIDVVGLRGAQVTSVKASFPDDVGKHLNFVDAEDYASLRAPASHAVMSKFIGHSVEERGLSAKAQVHVAKTRGISSVIELIQSIIDSTWKEA